MMRLLGFFAAGLAATFTAPLSAEDLGETAARFGARQTVTDVSISPGGTKLLYVSPGSAADETIYVVDLTSAGKPQAIVTMNEATSRLSGCDWATETRIVCQVYGLREIAGTIIYFTRMISLNDDGSDYESLTLDSNRALGILQDGGSLVALEVAGQPGHVLMTRRYIKETGANTRLFNDKEGLGVDLVDVTGGRPRSVESPNTLAQDYIADEFGRVRIMQVSDSSTSGSDGSQTRYLYRGPESDKWLPLSVVDTQGNSDLGFRPVAVDSGKNVVYGFDTLGGYTALYSVTLDGSGKRELLKSRDDVDVDGLIRIGRKGRVVGVSYATEKRYVEYFDPELEKLASGLGKALPGQPLISILDANEDESVLVIAASSDTDPGMVYLYEKANRSLGELFPLRDPLAGRAMGAMTPVTYPAADGMQIPGYLTLPPGSDGKNIPAIVLPHGGPGARDEWGFDWLPQFFAARGYAVLQPNFRGSAGYGEAWFGRNGFKSWELAVGDVNDAGRWLVSEGIADPEKMAVAGWSYGGYAALQSQVLDPDLYKAVVAIAPVTDLDLLREENRRYSSYLAVDRFVGNGPHIEAGSPARHAEAFRAPVLLVHGTMDLNVSDAQSKLMRDRLRGKDKPVDYLEFKGLDHSLVHSGARGIMLKRIGEFLDETLGTSTGE